VHDAAVVWTASKHLASNAVVIGARDPKGGGIRMYGTGAGQMDRVTACRLAVEKTGEAPHDAIAASDGFFPFADGPEILMQAGVTLIVHPGGSKRDDETFSVCNRMGVTCLTTGVRHFRH
jgi:phosphoribosylaminoimidazolecarboxamide formyltransferase/IMP cyclohydrolase